MVRRIAVLAGTLMLVTPAFGQKPLAFSSVPFPTLGGAAPGAIADFNGDGKLDIVFAPAGFPPAPLQLLLGNGDGTFRAGPALPAVSGRVAAGDLNEDGQPDLIVTTTQVSILPGRGDGTFAPHVDVCSGGALGSPFDLFGNSGALAFGDFNGDGVLDMLDYPTGLPVPNTSTALLLSGATTKPVIHPGSPRNAATYLSGPVSAGGLVTIFGDSLGVASCNGLGEQVRFNGIPASILYASPTQIDVQVPWEIAGATGAQVTALNNGAVSAVVTVSVAASSPGIFTQSETGSGQGAIVAGDTHRFATPDNPAHPGEYASIYGAGLGLVTNQPEDSSVSPETPLAQTKSVPVVTVRGVLAQVTFSGLAHGFMGLYQINFIVPASAPTGSAVPVLVSVDGTPSNTVTIAIQ